MQLRLTLVVVRLFASLPALAPFLKQPMCHLQACHLQADRLILDNPCRKGQKFENPTLLGLEDQTKSVARFAEL